MTISKITKINKEPKIIKNDCAKNYNCCSCGGNDCGCRECFDCNACESCLEFDNDWVDHNPDCEELS